MVIIVQITLCKCNCTRLLASHISDERLLSELFVLLHLSQTAVATALIKVSASLLSCDDFPRSVWDLQSKYYVIPFMQKYFKSNTYLFFDCLQMTMFQRYLLLDHISQFHQNN